MSVFNVYMHVTNVKIGYTYLKTNIADNRIYVVPTYRMDVFKMQKGKNKTKKCLSSFEVVRYGVNIDDNGNREVIDFKTHKVASN